MVGPSLRWSRIAPVRVAPLRLDRGDYAAANAITRRTILIALLKDDQDNRS